MGNGIEEIQIPVIHAISNGLLNDALAKKPNWQKHNLQALWRLN